MSELPLIEGVLKYTEENNIPFAMPGHKSGRGFFRDDKGINFINKLLKCDITEVEGVDNLHYPKGIIKEAEDKLTSLYGSKKSYFLINGSTSGNLIMIFSAFHEGDKVIVERNCHKSVMNAIIIRKLKPVYIKSNYNNTINAPLSFEREHFLNIVKNNKDAKGIIITYPNYYGFCCDLGMVIKAAKKYGMKVLVDSAHGAHFGFSKLLPKGAVFYGADMVVMSSHKTLPSFTQTSFLHVNNVDLIKKSDVYSKIFLSTSPSYMLMCSMDYGRYYLEKYCNNDYEKLIHIANKYRKKINSLGYCKVIDKEDVCSKENNVEDIDLSRYVINLRGELNAYKFLGYLRSRCIQCEMSDGHNLVLILSPFNEEMDFDKLFMALKECDIDKFKESTKTAYMSQEIPQKVLEPYTILEKEKEMCSYKASIGRISAEQITPYPPGIPLLMPGEVINTEIVNYIDNCIKNKIEIIGIQNDLIEVIK